MDDIDMIVRYRTDLQPSCFEAEYVDKATGIKCYGYGETIDRAIEQAESLRELENRDTEPDIEAVLSSIERETDFQLDLARDIEFLDSLEK